MTHQRSIAEEQKIFAHAICKKKTSLGWITPWSIEDEILHHVNGYAKASVSRNKREGRYRPELNNFSFPGLLTRSGRMRYNPSK